MGTKIYRGGTKTIVCPYCMEGDALDYEVRPAAMMCYDGEEDDSECVYHMGDVRDYKCKNCDFGFLVAQGELDSRP